ncbi:bone morphogenic protein 1 [Apostichopus japonicus]|uniref:Bone morphogenic protein 1 n=1 Tax=Stichopus japonicus TaxID=307972 RepID=A0A2G8K976_STIJA|nr:bone morphogenic protein 1 [Apostichopus japonicus]
MTEACGGLKTSLQGNISTPQYPNMYPRDKNCIWKISAPSSYHISLQFRDFQLEGTELCKYDFVEIRGGFSPDADRIGNRLCGSDIPETVTSPSNTLYIQFKSDSTVSKKGFFATFFADPPGSRTSRRSLIGLSKPQADRSQSLRFIFS